MYRIHLSLIGKNELTHPAQSSQCDIMAEATPFRASKRTIFAIILAAYLCNMAVNCGHDGSKLGDFPGYSSVDNAISMNHFDVKYMHDDTSSDSRMKRDQSSATPPSVYTDEDASHQYYNSSYYFQDTKYYIDLESEDSYTVIPHKILSNSHLTAAVVTLPFPFTFYGHNVSKAYIATGGFLNVGTFFHEFISATQYVAPLMGNFDPSLNDSAMIRYAHNATAFTVEWNGLHVNHQIQAGSFTFQTTLMKDGRIIFAYKRVPISPSGIGGGNGHKVTVGLSDGFYIDEPLFEGSSVIQRHIYRYHTLELDQQLVMDRSAFVLTPLTTCNQLSSSCQTCLGTRLPDFNCGWCQALSRCSSGFDRNRQDWQEAQCDEERHIDVAHCKTGLPAGAIVGILMAIGFFIALIVFVVWFVYSYTHPLSRSGLFLIEFRHIFKKDSSRNASSDLRCAVTISGDMHVEPSEAVEKVPNGFSAEQEQAGTLAAAQPEPLPPAQTKTPAPTPACAPEDVVPDIPAIPATASSVVQA